MNTVMIDLWPYMTPALIGLVIAYARYVHNLKERVAVMERTLEDLQKTIEKIQKRQDSHSQKQDDILQAISTLKVELVRQNGETGKQISTIAAKQEAIFNDMQIIKQELNISHKQ